MIIERKEVECTSVIQGVDICFKMTYVLDLDYQPQCRAVWSMLQHMVYNVPQVISLESQ